MVALGARRWDKRVTSRTVERDGRSEGAFKDNVKWSRRDIPSIWTVFFERHVLNFVRVY